MVVWSILAVNGNSEWASELDFLAGSDEEESRLETQVATGWPVPWEGPMKKVEVFFACIVAGCLVLAAIWRPGLVRFNEITVAGLLQIVIPLFLIAAFMERANEVLITAWRAPGANYLCRQVEKLTALTETDPMVLQLLHEAEDNLSSYKADTRRVAVVGMLALGILISAVGVRALEMLVNADVFRGLSAAQRGAFEPLDVLVTGALLGGGSEGIHKLVKVITDFLDATSKRIKSQA